MLGEDSDEEEVDTTERKRNTSSQDDEMGCTWGMGKRLKLLPEPNIVNSLQVVCTYSGDLDYHHWRGWNYIQSKTMECSV